MLDWLQCVILGIHCSPEEYVLRRWTENNRPVPRRIVSTCSAMRYVDSRQYTVDPARMDVAARDALRCYTAHEARRTAQQDVAAQYARALLRPKRAAPRATARDRLTACFAAADRLIGSTS